MNVNLDRDDLFCLVLGSTPHPLCVTKYSEYGKYNAGWGSWKWNITKLDYMTGVQLYELHLELKRDANGFKKS